MNKETVPTEPRPPIPIVGPDGRLGIIGDASDDYGDEIRPLPPIQVPPPPPEGDRKN